MRNNLVLISCAVVAAVHLFPAVESFVPPAAKGRSSSIAKASLFHWGERQSEKGDSQEDINPLLDDKDEQSSSLLRNSRRSFLSATAASSLLPLRSSAGASTLQSDKQLNLSNEELKKIVLSDIVDKSFLVSADITRSIYDESATFTDEIDVYTMDKWVKGTKALFIASGSRVSLVGDVDVSATEVSFRFDEDLMFNIPFKPVCSLTGKVGECNSYVFTESFSCSTCL